MIRWKQVRLVFLTWVSKLYCLGKNFITSGIRSWRRLLGFLRVKHYSPAIQPNFFSVNYTSQQTEYITVTIIPRAPPKHSSKIVTLKNLITSKYKPSVKITNIYNTQDASRTNQFLVGRFHMEVKSIHYPVRRYLGTAIPTQRCHHHHIPGFGNLWCVETHTVWKINCH